MAREGWQTVPSQPFGFFIVAVAYSIGWTAISSELARFAALYGNNVLLQLNLAYYLPSVPLLLLQACWDGRLDAKYGEHPCNLIRVIAGYGGCSAILACFPYTQGTLLQLLAAVGALGLASSIAFGSSFQLVSKFDAGSTVALTLGFVCSAPLVLLLEAGLRHGPGCERRQVVLLYQVVAAVAAAGLLAAVALLHTLRSWRRQQQQQQRRQLESSYLQLPGSWEPLLPVPSQDSSGRQSSDSQAQADAEAQAVGGPGQPGPTPQQLLERQRSGPLPSEAGHVAILEGSIADAAGVVGDLLPAWPAAVCLGLSVATSMFLFPFFTHFPSDGRFGAMLPVVLFWVRCFTDIAGRLLPKALAPPRPAILLALTAFKVLTVPLALLYIHGSLPVRSDLLLVLYVAVQWLLSGSLNTWAYLVLPDLVSADLGVRAASVMTLTFNTSCLAGLLFAIPFQAALS